MPAWALCMRMKTLRHITALSLLLIVAAGAAIVLTSAKKKAPVVFMVGDSTMADKTELTISPEVGWGQVFPTYLKDEVMVQNHAMNGRSCLSFVTEGRWQVVMSRIGQGDVLILQFGHNDAKSTDEKRYSDLQQYQERLGKMIDEAEAKGAHVILCTPIARRQFDSKTGQFTTSHNGYPYAARMLARQKNVPLLDLEEATSEWLISLGDEQSKQYFMNVAAGECEKFPDGKIDNTHLREAGALAVGRMAAEMLIAQKNPWLAKYIVLDRAEAKYSTYCRPKFGSDGLPVESDLGARKKK